MGRRTQLCIVTSVIGILSASAAAYAALASSTDAKVTFLATGPAGMKIEGTTSEFKTSDDGTNLTIVVPLGNLNTGIALRDRHMKEKYLEVPKYPEATLKIARSALKVPAGSDKVETDAQGTLQLHGQTKPVTVHYDSKGDGSAFATHGKFRINMTDFGISVPSYLGVTVKPEVDVNASFNIAGN